MNKTVKQIALFLLIGLVILLIFNLNQGGKDNKMLNYSLFIQKVENKKVARVVIEDNKKIFGYYTKDVITPVKKRSITTLSRKKKYDFWTMIPYADEKLMPLLLKSNVAVAGKDNEDSYLWKNVMSFLPFLIFFGFIWFLMIRQISSTGNKAMSFGKSKAKLNPEMKNKITFEDVAGADEAKEELEEIIEFLKDPKKFINIGAKIPTGVLLMGPPGTGKTLLARAIAGEADVPFFSISGSDFVEMFVGVGASRVRDLFEQGKKSAPCIIFIDEIDAVGRLRGAGLGGGHDEREQTLNQLLVEMDGFEKNEGVIIVAATNRPDVLDPALLRPGRFDRQVVVDIPDIRGREKILAVHSKKIPLSREVDLKVIARGTPGFTGADLANLVNESALLAARKNKKRVAMEEMEQAKDKVIMGPERRSMLISDNEKKITAYHEAGHVIVGMLIPSDPIHKATIIPRGRALGLVQFLPKEDRLSMTKQFFLNRIKGTFGGRIAEELKFNDISTGASNDIEQATNIARKMVCEWGMSDVVGPINFSDNNDQQVFLGRDISQSKNYSNETAQLIDDEVKRIITECKDEATQIIKDNYALFEIVAENLIERETLDANELVMLKDGKVLPPLMNGKTTSTKKESKEDSKEETTE